MISSNLATGTDGTTLQPKVLVCVAVLLACWGLFTFEGLSSAVAIWYGNEIFNHGFLILPAVIYFAYLKRGLWLAKPIAPTAWALPFVIGGILLYVVGYAGDIKLFMHAATFGLLPFLAWMLLGHQAAWALLFPLFFIVFTIPVGEQLVPWLQEVTADISVYMLQLSGIPLFRSGLYIEIPQGRFLVAEACSGISFFIASIVVGCVYSYLNFTNTKKRIGFVVLSIVYPIIANAIRVYGIILVGYLTDMEHAVGADHLIYGWFFFAIVLISLLAIGEAVRDKNAPWEVPLKPESVVSINTSYSIIGVALAGFILGFTWLNWIQASQQASALTTPQYINKPTNFVVVEEAQLVDYQPALSRPSETNIAIGTGNEYGDTILYQAWFDGQSSELVSGLHRLYDEQNWSLVRQTRLNDSAIPNLSVRVISNPQGSKRLVAFWYVIEGKAFTKATPAKLYQTGQVLLGKGAAGLMVIASVPISSNKDGEQAALLAMSELLFSIVGESAPP